MASATIESPHLFCEAPTPPETLIAFLNRSQTLHTSADMDRILDGLQNLKIMNRIILHVLDSHSHNMNSESIRKSDPPPHLGCLLTERQAGAYSGLLVGKWQ